MSRPAWWPSAREEDLLRLLLDRPIDPQRARRALLAAVDSPSDEELRLLPLLYHHLAENGSVPALTGSDLPAAVEGTLRRSWAQSRALRDLALRQAEGVLIALTQAGVAVAPLKGLAIDLWYANEGRAIGDLDLLVREEALATAVDLLATDGYLPRDASDPDAPDAKHSCALGHDEAAEVDLHWLLDVRLAGQAGRQAAMRRFWDGATVVEWRGLRLLRLRREHHLFHSLLHGAREDSRARARWVLDVVTLARRPPGEELDWGEVVATAKEARLTRQFSEALTWLAGLVPGLVPSDTLGALAGAGSTTAERFLWFLDRRAAREGLPRDVQRTLRWHLARRRDRGLLAGLLTYPAHLRAAGLVTSPGQLLAHVRRRRREERARRLA